MTMARALLAMVLAGVVCLVVDAADEAPDLARDYRDEISSTYKKENAFRTDYCLNGVWRVSLRDSITDAPPSEAGEYGFVLVPSAWTSPVEFPITGTALFTAGKNSGDCKWRGKAMKAFPCAWYCRGFTTPRGVEGRRVFLKLDRVTISGAIFLNGRKIGEQNERDEVAWDVTDALNKDDSPNQLAVRVSAVLNEEVKSYLGGDNTVVSKIEASLRGVTGDVWLRLMPKGAVVSRVFVTTSVRKKSVEFNVEVGGVKAESLTLAAKVFERGGTEPIRRFELTGMKNDGSQLQKFSFGGAWENPVIWDTDNPHLYEARVSLWSDGRKIDETLPVEFGFREVWIDGRDIILNGKPIHLFSYHAAPHDTFINAASRNFERELRIMRGVGFNSVQLGSEGTFQKGHSAQYYDDILKITDAEGVPAILPIAPVYAYEWNSPEGRRKWELHTDSLIRRYWNHPSIIIYSLNFNYLGYAGDMNPRLGTGESMPPDSVADLGRKRKEAGESEAFVREVDASRLVYHHASGNFGAFTTSNFYPNWTPIQELEDYPSCWYEKGVKPFIPVEIALPVYCLDLNRARQGNYETTRHSEMLEAEYLAPYLGPSAFGTQSDDYLKILSAGATSDKMAGADKYNVYQSYSWGYNLRMHEPLEAGIAALRPRFFQSWRTYGVNGFSPNNNLMQEITGQTFEPWHGAVTSYKYEDYTAPGPKPLRNHVPLGQDAMRTKVAEAISAGLKPVLAYFGGSVKEGFSSKDHAWFSGDVIEKQLVVVNDLRRDVDLLVKWRMNKDAGGSVVDSGEEKMTIPSGRSGFKPVRIHAPDVKEKSSFMLSMELQGCSADESVTRDFTLQVFPKRPLPQVLSAIGLFDPAGETKAMLSRMGVTATALGNESVPKDTRIVVVGRGALSKGKLPVSILKAVVEDGVTLLCMEQDDLSGFGLRLHQRGVRTVFPLVGEHPALSGLAPEDLREWRGDASLSESYPVAKDDAPDIYPEEPYKWGNRGVVCSCMIEKPQLGGAVPLAECEFDLGYTPLLEKSEGKGRVIFCQMEVTKRYGVDPAATLLADNILSYAASCFGASQVAIECGPEMKEFSSFVDAVVRRGADAAREARIIVRRGAALKEDEKNALRKAVEDGCSVVLVGQDIMKDLSWLPTTVSTASQTYYRTVPVVGQPLMRGVSVSDLFLKDRREDLVVTGGAGVKLLSEPGMIAEVPTGAGRFVLFAVDPVAYKDSKVTPERMNRLQAKLARVLCLIIGNLGGAFKPLAERSLSEAVAADIPLPAEWRFAIDLDNKGVRNAWHTAEFADSGWRMIKVPGSWESQGVNDANPEFPTAKRPYDGFAWYRCSIVVPESYKGKELCLFLGAVDDMDTTYFNGVKIGGIGQETKDYWAAFRDYPIPPDLVKIGKVNSIVVRVYDNYNDGGIMGRDPRITVGGRPTYPYVDEHPPFNPYHLTRW